jgi:hypothetical protein
VINGEDFIPLKLRGGIGKPVDTRQLHDAIQVFLEFEKKTNIPGWVVQWESWSSKKLGVQQWPSSITIETEEDFTWILGVTEEVSRFRLLVREILTWQPAIQPWLESKPLRTLELSSQWKNLRAVIDYVLNHELSAFYLRSIPVPVHTKFIKQHESVLLSLLRHIAPDRFAAGTDDIGKALGVKSKPLLYPLRWLDHSLAAQYTGGIRTLAVSSEDLQMMNPEVAEVWLVENETNLFLLQQRENAVGIVSMGNALHVLAAVPFFNKARLLYWGDLDEAGFRMLHQFRQMYPSLESILMDDITLQFHQHVVRNIDAGPVKMGLSLTENEYAAYSYLRQIKGRIEQEQLEQAFIQQYLFEKGLSS